MNDEEYSLITETEEAYTSALYTEVMLVLDSREAVSSDRDRLTAYFTAKGVAVTVPSAGSTQLYLGDDLGCS